MKIKLIIYYFLVFTMISSCSEEEPNKKELIVLVGCIDIEIVSDIENSIKGISDYAKSHNIIVQIKTDTEDCGYILLYGAKRKEISTAMTDADLLEVCADFFSK